MSADNLGSVDCQGGSSALRPLHDVANSEDESQEAGGLLSLGAAGGPLNHHHQHHRRHYHHRRHHHSHHGNPESAEDNHVVEIPAASHPSAASKGSLGTSGADGLVMPAASHDCSSLSSHHRHHHKHGHHAQPEVPEKTPAGPSALLSSSSQFHHHHRRHLHHHLQGSAHAHGHANEQEPQNPSSEIDVLAHSHVSGSSIVGAAEVELEELRGGTEPGGLQVVAAPLQDRMTAEPPQAPPPSNEHRHHRSIQLGEQAEDVARANPQWQRLRHQQQQQQQQHQQFRSNPFNSGLWISIELAFLLAQIGAALVVLPLSLAEHPNDPLGLWILGYAAGCAALLPLLLWRYSQWCARSPGEGGLATSNDQEVGAAVLQEDAEREAVTDEEALLPPRSESAAGGAQQHAEVPENAAQGQGSREAGLRSRGNALAHRILCFRLDDPRLPMLVAKYKAAVDCFFALWYVAGSMWVLGGTTTFHDAPLLYSLSAVYLAFSSISYGIPFLLCATICCCLPCIIAVMGSDDMDPSRPQGAGFGPGNSKGAAPEAIAALPRFVFRTRRSRKGEEDEEGGEEEGKGKEQEVGLKGTGEGPQGNGNEENEEFSVGPASDGSSTGSEAQDRQAAESNKLGVFGAWTPGKWLQGWRGHGAAAPALATVGTQTKGNAEDGEDVESVGSAEEGLLCADAEEERAVAGGDAVCCICLGHYRDGAELRQLPCSHHFHAACVDTWLGINGCCPLCKESIAPGSRELET